MGLKGLHPVGCTAAHFCPNGTKGPQRVVHRAQGAGRGAEGVGTAPTSGITAPTRLPPATSSTGLQPPNAESPVHMPLQTPAPTSVPKPLPTPGPVHSPVPVPAVHSG